MMGLLPLPIIRDGKYSQVWLYGIATALSYTSATVVTGLMAAAAECCDVDEEVGRGGEETLTRGRALGGFRSKVGVGVATGGVEPKCNEWS